MTVKTNIVPDHGPNNHFSSVAFLDEKLSFVSNKTHPLGFCGKFIADISLSRLLYHFC
jgi:hypothetical protein